VVIGGGLTGCASAYALASGGVDVVLVEADRLANGSTAGGLGAIVPQPDASFVSVEREAGLRAARTGWTEARRDALDLASVLRKLKVKCDLEATHVFINAATAAEALALKKEQAARKHAGLDAPLVGGPAARAAIGTDSASAIRLRDAFVYDPVRASLGLASAAVSKGARVFEQSAVVRTRFTRKDAQVILRNGRIRARLVIVATGEPGALFSQLRRHVRRQEGFAVVTHPLPAAMRQQVGPRDALLAETGPDRHWLRWLPDGRILFTGAVGAPTPSRLLDKALVQRTAQLMYELSVRYPAISGLPAAWGWNVPVVSTPDGLPWIGSHRNYPHHFFALASGWLGDSLGWFAARAAVRHFRQDAHKTDDALSFARYL
jgi:glycine/D-amino acid oxidase-like deaminating enzyme